jgi:hypothetical protein
MALFLFFLVSGLICAGDLDDGSFGCRRRRRRSKA